MASFDVPRSAAVVQGHTATAVNKASKSPPARFVELDALRGIAAMMVVLLHYSFFTAENHKAHSIVLDLAQPFIAGHEAVILFFLLSGFVLSLSTWKGTEAPYKDYVIRRIFRIYVPYLGALALAVIGCAVFWRRASVTLPWMQYLITWSRPPTVRSVIDHVVFIGDYDVSRYNRPFWTLIMEMRISLIFPFVCLGLKRLKTWMGLLVAVALSAGGILLTLRFPESRSWFSTFHYLAFFIIGALLARRLNRLPWPVIPEWVRHAMIPFSILLFAYATKLARFLHGAPAAEQEFLLDWPIAVGALGMIYLAATHTTIKRTLGHFIPRFLGHISYSLYLIHHLVILSLMTMLYGRIPVPAIFPIYIVLAVGLSAAYYKAVELPSMQMGKRLTRPKVKAVTAATT